MFKNKATRFFFGDVVLLMTFAALASWWATRNGPGFEGNSIPYVSAARTFAQTGAMMVPNVNGQMEPLLLWPPLYPATMGLGAKVLGDVLTAGRWLNIILFPLNIFLLAVLLQQLGLAKPIRSVICLLFTFAPVTLYAHVNLMSESTALFWWLATLNILLLYPHRQTWTVLIGAALAAAMTWLARFVGVAAIASGALFIALVTTGPWGQRLVRAVVFGLLAAMPLQLWVHTIAHVTTMGTRRMGVYGLAKHQIDSTLHALLRWIVPFDEMASLKLLMLVIFIGWLALSVPAIWRARKSWFVGGVNDEGLSQQGLWLILLNLVAVEGLIFATGIFLDPTLDMGERMHYFGFVFILVLMGTIGTMLFRGALDGRPAWSRVLAAGVPLLIVAAYLVGGSRWIWQADELHLNYNSLGWRESPTLAEVEKHYSHTLIYTNQPGAIYLRTGRTDMRLVPYAYEKTRPIALGDFQDNFSAMLHETAANQGVIIYFFEENARAPIEEVKNDPRLKIVETLNDAIIFAPAS
jgi:hypothetical protein